MLSRREVMGAGAAASAIAAMPSLARSASVNAGSLSATLDAYFEPFVKASDFSGVVIMERGGKRLVTRSWGAADFDYDIPNTPDTRFAAESISKLFTRAAVLALQAAGRLDLDDRMSRFISDFPSASQISIRQLVDHKAGISRDLSLADATQAHSPAQLVALIAKTQNAPPGETVSYSNNGYRLLARVIELAGGGTFDNLIRELVLDPRAMRDTLFGGFGEVMKRRATGYVPGPGWRSIVAARPFNYANGRGEASYYTTPNDLLRMLRTLPLERADLDAAPKLDSAGRPIPRQIGHDGFGNGFANLAYAFPDEDARLVVMGNIQSGLFTSMHDDLRRILFGEKVRPPSIERPPSLPPTPRWREFVGSYDLRPGAPLIIRRNADVLEVSAGEDFHPLIAIAPNRFFMRLRYATITFPAAPAPVSSLLWEEGGAGYSLKKLVA